MNQNYLYTKVCSDFIYIATKSENSKSTESCSSVISILHPQFPPLSALQHL